MTDMTYPIHIAFCVNDAYVPYITVTIKSIMVNNLDDMVIHVLTDRISDKNRMRLEEVTKSCNHAKLQIHTVCDEALRGLKATWSIYTWYRVLLPSVLPEDIHRVLYLDADTIVTGQLNELFSLDMAGKAIAGTIDPESFNPETFKRCGYSREKKYICAGVMLMNLDYWREHSLSEKIIAWGYENNDRIKFPDQDTINYLCQDTKIMLPLRYGIMNVFLTDEIYRNSGYGAQLTDCIDKPAIIHYAGQSPWIKEFSHRLLQNEWLKYSRMLEHPVKRTYMTKGWLFVKMMVWNLCHPFRNRNQLTLDVIRQKLQNSL